MIFLKFWQNIENSHGASPVLFIQISARKLKYQKGPSPVWFYSNLQKKWKNEYEHDLSQIWGKIENKITRGSKSSMIFLKLGQIKCLRGAIQLDFSQMLAKKLKLSQGVIPAFFSLKFWQKIEKNHKGASPAWFLSNVCKKWKSRNSCIIFPKF